MPSNEKCVIRTPPSSTYVQVDTTEFIDGIAGLNKCCGGNCPLYTFCNPLRFEVGLCDLQSFIAATHTS